MSAIVGPIAPYNNVPIEPQFYQPSRFVISAISFGNTTTVTTTANVNYVVGQSVRLIIPVGYGCRQLNEQQGYVLSLPASNQVQVGINSANNVDPFVNAGLPTSAQILAIGDVNMGQQNTGRSGNLTYVPGSFINISPA